VADLGERSPDHRRPAEREAENRLTGVVHRAAPICRRGFFPMG
jgi:hypothetical protein